MSRRQVTYVIGNLSYISKKIADLASGSFALVMQPHKRVHLGLTYLTQFTLESPPITRNMCEIAGHWSTILGQADV